METKEDILNTISITRYNGLQLCLYLHGMQRVNLSTPSCPLLEQFPIPSVMIPLLLTRRVSEFISRALHMEHM